MLAKLGGNSLIQTKLTTILDKYLEISIDISAEEAMRIAALLRNSNLGARIISPPCQFNISDTTAHTCKTQLSSFCNKSSGFSWLLAL